jgi:glycosyltransferase involved in cell wall biosynthesis
MNGQFTRRLKVAVLLASSESMGGAFVQSLNIARLLMPRENDAYVVEYIALDKADRERIEQAGLPISVEIGQAAGSLVSALVRFPALRGILRRIYKLIIVGRSNQLDRLAAKKGYDILIFTSPSRHAIGVWRTPFVFTIWDLCHRDHPEFPEFTEDGSFGWRESLFGSVLPRASGYIVDTEVLAERVANTYRVERAKAIIIPFQPSLEILEAPTGEAEILSLRRKYGLARPFVFYPAQFWPHKNHAYILRALRVLKSRGLDIDAVFSGTDQGGLERVRKLAGNEQLGEQVKFVGFLPTVEMAQMYRSALALVMPTYFGPTNIPPLEAEALGCHLIYSDLPGHREFAGDDCFYCDLNRPESLADLIACVMRSPKRQPRRRPVPEQTKAQLDLLLARVGAKISAWTD